ncbi:ABC transporter substrate-binding protein [Microbacterium marmarense]|uniref:ABC transporter substrate-binding protein n=1 Tax=Microbacterium marmarense TaxID=3122051 RepID=A0ABU8LUM1_9MICO
MRFSKKGRVAASLIAVGAVVALAGCTQSDPTAPETDGDTNAMSDTIVVGSFAFPESEILGEIYAQALEAAGFDVDTQFNIGPRQQTIPALQDGSINLIPEYNGNLLAYYDTEFEERTTEDVDAALVDAVAADDLVVYDSAAAEDKDAYVVTSEFAEANDLTEIGDLAGVQPFVLGANPQFGELGYGIPGLASVYGVTDVEFVPIEDFGGPDTVKQLVDDTVQVADIYTTSPALVAEDLVVLEDPENLIAAQNIIPLASTAIDSEELAAVLNEISAALTTDDLIALRDRVEGDEQASAATAATDWLTENGLL